MFKDQRARLSDHIDDIIRDTQDGGPQGWVGAVQINRDSRGTVRVSYRVQHVFPVSHLDPDRSE